MARGVARWRTSLFLMAASGFAGLGYQIIWTEQSALWLGHEAAAVLAVVAAFFGGIGAGAWWLGGRIEKSDIPARWYAACELTIALWSLLLALAMSPVSARLLRWIGTETTPLRQWSWAFCGTFILLLPATAAMGATLPAMERVTARLHAEGRPIGALYAANTFGAVLGVLVAALLLVPAIGLGRTAAVCATLNVLCSLTSWFAFPVAGDRAAEPRSTDAGHTRAELLRLAITGLLGIGYEVLVVRVLSEVTEDTVYTFSVMLAVYLVGTAAGATAYQRWSRRRAGDDVADALLGALAVACLFGAVTLWAADRSKAAASDAFGEGPGAAILAEAIPAVLAFGLPTIVMGALFCHLAGRARAAGIGFGRALGANTFGAAVAPALFGVLILPTFGPKLGLIAIAAGYLALVPRRSWARAVVWGPAVAVVALALFAPSLAFVDVPPGGRVVSYREGVMAAVSVVEDEGGVARLRIDDRAQEGSSATERVDGRQAWLPLLLHPAPRHALFLGLGTGITASSAALDPALQVDAVELLPEVIAASDYFTRNFADGAAAPRLHVIASDARRYVRASERRYDVIVSDNFHPARSGSGALYTVEHFRAVRERLEPNGVFCQWLPLHQLDGDTLRSIVQSFLVAYPEGSAVIASNSLVTPVLGLIGRRDGALFSTAAVRERLRGVKPVDRVIAMGFEDDLAVLGNFLAGTASLRRFARNAPLNTDDRPVVAYGAPRITYAPDSTPASRLLALLREMSVEPGEVISASDPEWSRRLAAYWAARDRFVESGRDVRPSARVGEMLAQVREPLLAVLRISPDFRPAYDPLLAMATALAQTDVEGARGLFVELARTQPARSEAPRALASLEPALRP